MDSDALPSVSDDVDAYDFYQDRGPSTGSPERSLMIAENAIQDARCLSGPQSAQVRDSAMAWLFSDDMSHLFSYRAVCDVLDIDPGRARRRVEEVNPRDRCDANQTSTLESPAADGSLGIDQAIEVERMKCMSTDHVGWLNQEIEAYRKNLAQAEAEVDRLRPIVASFEITVKALAAAPARSNGNGATENGHRQSNPVGVRTLERKPGYDCSLADAVRRILDETTEASCADLVQAIFADGVDAQRARKSLTSAMAEGIKKGQWRSLGGGRYAAV